MTVCRRHAETQHNRQCGSHFLSGLDGNLGIADVEDGLDEQSVHTTVCQSLNLFFVGLAKYLFVKRFSTRRYRCRATGRTDAACYETRLVRRTEFIGTLTGQTCCCEVDVANTILQAIVSQRDALGIKGVGFDDIRTSLQIFAMNFADNVWLCHYQHIVTVFIEMILLNHGTHRAIEQQDTVGGEYSRISRISRISRTSRLSRFHSSDNFFHLAVGIILHVSRMQDAGGLEIIHDLHCLLHLALIVEVHLDMNTVTTDIVKQRTQLVERHPTSHNALAASQDLLIQVIPLR